MAGYRIQGVLCRVKDKWVKLHDKDTGVHGRIQDTGRKMQGKSFMG